MWNIRVHTVGNGMRNPNIVGSRKVWWLIIVGFIFLITYEWQSGTLLNCWLKFCLISRTKFVDANLYWKVKVYNGRFTRAVFLTWTYNPIWFEIHCRRMNNITPEITICRFNIVLCESTSYIICVRVRVILRKEETYHELGFSSYLLEFLYTHTLILCLSSKYFRIILVDT